MKLFNAIEFTNPGIVFFDTECNLVGMNWYDNAKRIMKNKKIKQRSLLQIFDVKTPGAVSHYLSGNRQPDPMQVKALADKIDCSMDELFGNEDAVKSQIYAVMRAVDDAIALSNREFTDAEKMTIYRAAFGAGLDTNVTTKQVTEYLKVFVSK